MLLSLPHCVYVFVLAAFSQSPTVTPSTTAMSSTVTPGPSPTGTPEPSPNNEYVYQDGKGVCLRMIADVVVVFDYEDGDGKVKSSLCTFAQSLRD